jgi:hypothetical protein
VHRDSGHRWRRWRVRRLRRQAWGWFDAPSATACWSRRRSTQASPPACCTWRRVRHRPQASHPLRRPSHPPQSRRLGGRCRCVAMRRADARSGEVAQLRRNSTRSGRKPTEQNRPVLEKAADLGDYSLDGVGGPSSPCSAAKMQAPDAQPGDLPVDVLGRGVGADALRAPLEGR